MGVLPPTTAVPRAVPGDGFRKGPISTGLLERNDIVGTENAVLGAAVAEGDADCRPLAFERRRRLVDHAAGPPGLCPNATAAPVPELAMLLLLLLLLPLLLLLLLLVTAPEAEA